VSDFDSMPANIDAERVILGAVLLDNAALYTTEQSLREDDFSLDSHRRIFLRMAELMNSQRAIDIVTLANALTQRKEIEVVGGVAYLASLTEGLPRRPVIGEYIRIVKDKSLLRKLMSTCSLAIARAADQPESALELLGDTMRDLDRIEDASLRGADLESVGQWLNQNDVFAERVPGIFTGIEEYDEMTFGLHPGELTVFAGRTSTGKTSHCGTVAWQIARCGKCVAVFINEQQKQSFIGRMLCGRSGVSFKAYRRSQLDMIERIYIEDAVKEFKTLPIFWDQRSSMSVASIRAKAARLKRSGELDVILIDQLSRVSGEGIWQKGMRSDEVIGEKVSALKGMAVDLDVPVGLYHQLNRETTKNEESRPRLENLRGSGNIEEHADNVAMFYRPKPTELEAEILLLKQRDGAVGTAHCEFVGEVCLWRNRSVKR
jgi:replicative DNA helicase